MNGFKSVFMRELKGYFITPTAYVFLVIFLFFSAFLTFQNGFFDGRQASLRLFFANMPLLFLFIAPAMAMRLWSEERRSRSIELLLTLPITTPQAVLGKFLAAWTVLALALALTFPMAVTAAYLGDPDWGPIATGYLASLLLAGTYLAIGSFFSALSRNQVISFILGVVACGLFLYAGSPTAVKMVASSVCAGLAEIMEMLSFQSRFESMGRGVLEIRDLAFFLLMTAGWLWASMVVVEERKAV